MTRRCPRCVRRRGRLEGLHGVKPTDSCRQAHAFQQTVLQLRLELSLMPPCPVLEKIEPALRVLLLAQYFASLEPLQALRVDLGAVPHPAPEQRGLIVALAHIGTDMRNEIAGIDAWVDPMQRASDLVGLAVVQRPEGAVGAAVARR